MGLNDSFFAVRGRMLMMTPLPNLNQADSMLVHEETQRTSISLEQYNQLLKLLSNLKPVDPVTSAPASENFAGQGN
ncbi:hypothetical protein L6164_026054 [Bauhinia variegata]|uniref:Uncharacterized protein n=1 Tax=Bauhinia variegata TaxID=167791 RepID=A0ACB9M2K6_BAUVA|nr:hypothetical protein L6164_026054 [Bauhinia variegata]